MYQTYTSLNSPTQTQKDALSQKLYHDPCVNTEILSHPALYYIEAISQYEALHFKGLPKITCCH